MGPMGRESRHATEGGAPIGRGPPARERGRERAGTRGWAERPARHGFWASFPFLFLNYVFIFIFISPLDSISTMP